MKKNLKIVFIICLVIGILATGVNLFAASQQGRLTAIEEQQAARKKALAQIEAAAILGIDPNSVVVPDEVQVSGMDTFLMKLIAAKNMIWVVAMDMFIIGVGGFAYSLNKAKKAQKGGVKPGSKGKAAKRAARRPRLTNEEIEKKREEFGLPVPD